MLGVGETSINLTALHGHRIKRWFGQDRRVIRCDEFPASRAHFFRQLFKVVGAGIENPKDLRSLRQHLSPEGIFVALDNTESILDLQGPNAEEMYATVHEPTQSRSVCVRITSRTPAIPSHCKAIGISTSSIEAAQDIFYRIYKHDERTNRINGILEQLKFHPLSIRYLQPLPGATNGTPTGWRQSGKDHERERFAPSTPRTS